MNTIHANQAIQRAADQLIDQGVSYVRRERDRYHIDHAALRALALVIKRWWESEEQRHILALVLAREWPHASTSDDGRVAYTRSDEHGNADRQTVTSPGKYLRRVFPMLKDHEIREITGACNAAKDTIAISRNIVEMIELVQRGPYSCMRLEDGEDLDDHPYLAYDPKFGWGLAYRMSPQDEVIARGLVLYSESGSPQCYVRTFQGESGCSGRDDALEVWLIETGFENADSWPHGAKLRSIPWGEGHVLPYIDGRNKCVAYRGGHFEICDRDDADYECDDASGRPECIEARGECSDCGAEIRREGDAIFIGRHADRYVCEVCADNYMEVIGCRRRTYMLPEDEVVFAGGDAYDPRYLCDNNIVQLSNGYYAQEDDTFVCPITDDTLHVNDGVYTEDEGLVAESETWRCAISGVVYSTNTEPVLVNGEKCHPDNVDEDDDVDPPPMDRSLQLNADFGLPYWALCHALRGEVPANEHPSSESPAMKPLDIVRKTLFFALSMKRPHGSREEGLLVASMTKPALIDRGLQWIDGAGNLHTDLRHEGYSRTLFVAHADTVHRRGGPNHFTQVGDLIHAGHGPGGKPSPRAMRKRELRAARGDKLAMFNPLHFNEPLGADDAVGVAILAGLMAAKVPGYYVITRGEECGGVGSKHLATEHEELLREFDRAIAIDRRDVGSVITHQAGGRCCSDLFAEALSEALNERGMLYMPDDTGVYTDTAEFTDLISECTNLSAGYWQEHTGLEHMSLPHVEALFDAMRTIDWESLPTRRDPDVDEEAMREAAEREWWSGFRATKTLIEQQDEDDPFYFNEYPGLIRRPIN